MGNNFEEGYVYKSPEHDQHHFFLWKTWSWEFQKKIHTALFWQKCVLFSLKDDNINSVYHIYIYNIRTLLVKMKFICTSFRNRPVSQRVQMNFIFNDNVRILCLFCNVKKVGKLVRFRQKGQKQASFLAFHKYIYPAINTFAVQICYTNNFLLYSY